MAFWIFLIILYRDLGVSFVRLLMSRRGITMGSRISGKIKAWVYAICGAVGLALMTIRKIPVAEEILGIANIVGYVCFIGAAAIALWSLGDYIWAIRSKK